MVTCECLRCCSLCPLLPQLPDLVTASSVQQCRREIESKLSRARRHLLDLQQSAARLEHDLGGLLSASAAPTLRALTASLSSSLSAPPHAFRQVDFLLSQTASASLPCHPQPQPQPQPQLSSKAEAEAEAEREAERAPAPAPAPDAAGERAKAICAPSIGECDCQWYAGSNGKSAGVARAHGKDCPLPLPSASAPSALAAVVCGSGGGRSRNATDEVALSPRLSAGERAQPQPSHPPHFFCAYRSDEVRLTCTAGSGLWAVGCGLWAVGSGLWAVGTLSVIAARRIVPAPPCCCFLTSSAPLCPPPFC